MAADASPPRAVALLSGGLDSCVAAAWATSNGWEVHALTVDYGQRHRAELGAAARVAAALGTASHRVVSVDLRAIGGSSITGPLPVEKDREPARMAAEIPSTYVPARNTVFLSLALGLAETLLAERLVIGANALDYSGYPDCRDEFLRSFEATANLGTAAGVRGRLRFRVEAPLLSRTKAEIVRLGVELKAPLELTLSCYDPQPGGVGVGGVDGGVGTTVRPCGRCDACRLRAKGFEEAGVADPARDGPRT